MIPLYHEPHYTFRFGEPRVVPRFHLDGPAPGTPVAVFRFDPVANERREWVAAAVVGAGGWVDLAEPLLVSETSGFVVVPTGC